MQRLPTFVRILVSLSLAVGLWISGGCGPAATPPPASGPEPGWQTAPPPSSPSVTADELPAEPSERPVAEPPPPPSRADDILAFCVAETNRYRASKGRPPVRQNAELERYALEGAKVDTRSRSPHKHFSDTRGGNIAFAENECLAFQGWTLDMGGGTVRGTVAECIKAFFDEGPGGGHYENMMGDYATLGCAVLEVGGEGLSIVQDFGY